MAKSRNNLLGVGGQRRKLSRADRQGNGPAHHAVSPDADRKQELLRRMRERTRAAAEAADGPRPEGGAQPADGRSSDGSC
ncbi:DUF6243 family protein [Streptomyces sp. C10-9-1]|uniref:DUF6243 family protein n=1 Tax=Streptomyces sp. C10-9-1 TaxID=1859285 RepID=UPI0021116DBF|nr:DUF6243 family protein [Streptomyces sp. C10-9-1]MCQ6553724.1 DUF6243 family protein [Streptomyces sp. C10-9-1]